MVDNVGAYVDKVWIVCGKITDEEAAEAYQSGAKVGDIEYQFSDGPPGERTYSADYVDLAEGIRDHAHCKIYWPEPNAGGAA